VCVRFSFCFYFQIILKLVFFRTNVQFKFKYLALKVSKPATMPLLHKQKFVKKPLPTDLNPNQEIFYCKLTQEIFIDYEYVKSCFFFLFFFKL
jgi:hypothetical protein